jgi:hypothetical protein
MNIYYLYFRLCFLKFLIEYFKFNGERFFQTNWELNISHFLQKLDQYNKISSNPKRKKTKIILEYYCY